MYVTLNHLNNATLILVFRERELKREPQQPGTFLFLCFDLSTVIGSIFIISIV